MFPTLHDFDKKKAIIRNVTWDCNYFLLISRTIIQRNYWTTISQIRTLDHLITRFWFDRVLLWGNEYMFDWIVTSKIEGSWYDRKFLAWNRSSANTSSN